MGRPPVYSQEQLTTTQERFVRMAANGYSTPEIIKEIWGLAEVDDQKKYHSYECMLSRWRKHPKYEEVWRDEVKKYDFSDYSKARRTLRRGLDDEKDKWLALQSAINIINQAGGRIFRDENNTVTVKIEGMPQIGAPDGDSDD